MGKWDALIPSLLNLNSISSYLPNLCVLLTMKFIFNLPLPLLSHNTVGLFSMGQQCRCICWQQRKNRLVVHTVLIQLCNGMCTECAYRNVFARFLSHCLQLPWQELLTPVIQSPPRYDDIYLSISSQAMAGSSSRFTPHFTPQRISGRHQIRS